MRYRLMFVLLRFVTFLTACINNETSSHKDTPYTYVSSERELIMPDIVFLNVIYNNPNDYDSFLLTFLDKNGNYYSKDNFVYEDNNVDYPLLLNLDELIDSFNSNPQNYTKHEQVCDVTELQNYHKIICELSENADYDLIYPEQLPAVESRSVDVYGIYYDSNNELRYIPIHSEKCMTQIYANDERANNVYKWYTDAIKIKE